MTYTIEIAGHDAGLQHYDGRMLLDTASLEREYREWFVPEDWSPPFIARAELSFRLDALDEAQLQLSPEELADRLGLPLPEDYNFSASPVEVELQVKFALDLYSWTQGHEDPERWNSYLATISQRDKLEAGLRNLRGEVRRALQAASGDDEWDETLTADAEMALSTGYGLLPRTLLVLWTTRVDATSDEEELQSAVDHVMQLVHAGVEATRAFQLEIEHDYGGTA